MIMVVVFESLACEEGATLHAWRSYRSASELSEKSLMLPEKSQVDCNF
jgi:hypothetical protein